MNELTSAVGVAGMWAVICVSIPFVYRIARIFIIAGVAMKTIKEIVKAVAEKKK